MTLRLDELRFTYPGWTPTLDGASLQVARGQNVFLLGPSGSGKSTLLRIAAGLASPGSGRVLWEDEEITAQPAHARRIGMMFQEPALFPHLDVVRNASFGARYRADRPTGWGAGRRFERQEAERVLELVQVPRDAWHRRVDQVSGGQRQRIALARTLAAAPRAVLLDEPFSGLDRDLRDSLGPQIRDLLKAENVAALWVTHDRDEAFRLGDAVWTLQAGKVAPAIA
jgi:ABC-type sulfate/molybdate transport systems ATPase subunit